MVVRSELPGLSDADARRVLEGLPRAGGYEVIVKPLRYRTRPHLAARCEFEEHRIVLQVPVPFRPFREPVVFAARRKRGPGMRFAWASETVSFRLRREVLRFSTAMSGCIGTCMRRWAGEPPPRPLATGLP
jgi:hypothetical protein